MIDLILMMIVAFDNFGTELNFTKEDIDRMIKENDVFDDKYVNLNINERAYIILLKNGYITKEHFAKHMDIEFEDKNTKDPFRDSFYIIVDGFDDVLNDNHDTEIKMLDGNYEDWNYDNYYDVDVSQYWDDYTEKTLKNILVYCITNKLEIEDEDGEMIVMTAENTTFKNGDIYFNDTPLYKLINKEDGLKELKDELNFAICEAQESADMGECYNKAKNAFIDNVGEYEIKTVTAGDKTKDKLYIKIDKSLSEINDFLIERYGEYDFEEEEYGNIPIILRSGMEIYDYRPVDFDNIYASIDDDTLNEYTQNRL